MRLTPKLSRHTRGVLYILLAAFFFSGMTVFIRLAGDLPTMQKAMFRNLVAAVVMTFVLARSPEKFKIKRDCLPELFLRAMFGTAGLVANFWAVDHMNIADANMLNKLSPFFAIIMSAFIMKEIPSRFEWFTVALAFAGALFVIKPTAGLASFPALVGAFGGFAAGTAYTFVRKASAKGERGSVIVMFFSVFSCLAALPFAIADYTPMSLRQLLFLLGAGCCGACGQIAITAAYRCAPAKEISVFDYSQILWASLFSFLVFGSLPDHWSLLGYLIIIGTAVFRWAHDRKAAAG